VGWGGVFCERNSGDQYRTAGSSTQFSLIRVTGINFVSVNNEVSTDVKVCRRLLGMC